MIAEQYSTHLRRARMTLLLGIFLIGNSLTLFAQDAKPENAATRDYAVAVGLENKQLYPQAAARWQKFIDTYRGDARLDRAHYHLATCQLQAGEADKAAAAYRNLLAAFPDFKDRDAAQFNLSMALYQAGPEVTEGRRLESRGRRLCRNCRSPIPRVSSFRRRSIIRAKRCTQPGKPRPPPICIRRSSPPIPTAIWLLKHATPWAPYNKTWGKTPRPLRRFKRSLPPTPTIRVCN